MSATLATQEIERFLRSKDHEVLCLMGKWGIGKSFIWDKLLKQEKVNLTRDRYSYVSLFGLNDLDGVKLAILENLVASVQIGEKLTSRMVVGQGKQISKSVWRGWLSRTRHVADAAGLDGLGALLQQVSFAGVRDALICFDDLERRGEGLRLKDLLGLISLLDEHRNCKVLVIANEDAFEEDDAKEFKKYSEKVFDSHVIFAPSPEEAAAIALPGQSTVEAVLKTSCVALGLSNIRIIRKVLRLTQQLKKPLAAFNPKIADDCVKILALLGFSVYGEDSPPLEFLTTRRTAQLNVRGEPGPDEKRWGATLDAYGFYYFGGIDRVFIDAIKDGFIDEARLRLRLISSTKGTQSSNQNKPFMRLGNWCTRPTRTMSA